MKVCYLIFERYIYYISGGNSRGMNFTQNNLIKNFWRGESGIDVIFCCWHRQSFVIARVMMINK